MDVTNIHGIMGHNNGTFDLEFNEKNGCGPPLPEWYDSYFGITLAVPDWEAFLTALVLCIVIVLIIVGNVLVILSVFTYKPLRIVQNFFIVSLAVADLTVALLVLPLNVAYSLLGRWKFGIYLCKMWLTCDVLCCTSSILNLCAIALDRYWAITDPINYAQKRTVGRVLLLITGVWLLSLLISSPPLLGWNDWPEEFTSTTLCQLNSDPGYVIYSSLGSFFIPLIVMAAVYIEVFVATKRRLRERAESTKNNTIATRPVNANLHKTKVTSDNINSGIVLSMRYKALRYCRSSTVSSSDTMLQNSQEPESNETETDKKDTDILVQYNPEIEVVATPHKKTRRLKVQDSIKCMKSKTRKSHQTKQLDGPQSKVSDIENIRVLPQSPGVKRVDSEIDEEIVDITSTQTGTSSQKKPSGVHQFIEEKQKISLSKERRAARTLGIIMGAFVICWLPFFLMYVILPFCSTCCPTAKFKNFITWLGYINSVLNPIIYTIFNLDYRRAFKRLLGLN